MKLSTLIATASMTLVNGQRVENAWDESFGNPVELLLSNNTVIHLDNQEVEFCADQDGIAVAKDFDGTDVTFEFLMLRPMTWMDLL